MTETITDIARPSPLGRDPEGPQSSARRRSRCTSIAAAPTCKLEAEGVIRRQGDGFPLDQSRVAYLRHLRRERRQSPRSEADVDHVRVKTEMFQLRLMEKRRELVRRDDVDALIDELAGITLTHLSGMAARCSRDIQMRRNIDAVVDQVRREMAAAALAKANEWNEPPPNEQD
ncbi:hypothetical protein AC629_11505 [Bradyrhizobium sp. NAS80.1]|uniref:hypothetical protein n=1 Tax=Bradyrhizobium sp. NAS80.1 TaxID=1680159 RepID=UPI000960076B|nr:hypothetical protein [Bradyrhizobium sp. NAS80.1]OKO88013.1 hypothetical protein AC629_11505 [Bradyrhizobium sp. NAS80.1]